jgi:ABC-type bacteriocin/lantibiotic exporter with double-glycine peptidase domain
MVTRGGRCNRGLARFSVSPMARELRSGEQTLRFTAKLLREQRGYLAAAIALAALNRGAALVLPVSTRYLVDSILRPHREDLLPVFLLVLAAAMALQGCAAYFLNSLVTVRSHTIVCTLRMRVVQHVLRLPLQFHDANTSGAAATRIVSDTESIRHVLGFPMVELVSAAVTGLISAIVLLRINPMLAAIGISVLLVAAAGFAVCVALSRGYVRERAAIIADGTGRLAEALAGIRMVKAFAAEGREESAQRANLDRLLANIGTTTKLSSAVAVARVLIGGSAGLLLSWVGVHEIGSGQLTVGGLIVAVVLWAMMAGALMQGGAAAIQISESLAGIDRIRELLERPREDDQAGRTTAIRRGPGRIIFDNVSFSYDRSVPVIDRVSFELPPGSVTAVVGNSGAGKSTIAAIAASLYTPTAGRVLVDGYDLRTVKLETYRKELGFVPQDVLLMSGTIRENILLDRAGVTEAEFRAACRTALVCEFAERFPMAYETEIGERGVQLSGGQRQRIAIARALLADPRILILDEPIASLDANSAEIVQQALERAIEGRTTIVIAHSPAAVSRADQVLVLRNGRIVARGTPPELPPAEQYVSQAYPGQVHGMSLEPAADVVLPRPTANAVGR